MVADDTILDEPNKENNSLFTDPIDKVLDVFNKIYSKVIVLDNTPNSDITAAILTAVVMKDRFIL